jgi:hypothetical protein
VSASSSLLLPLPPISSSLSSLFSIPSLAQVHLHTHTHIHPLFTSPSNRLVPTPEELFGPLITQYYIQSKFPTEFKKWSKTAVEIDMKNNWKPIAPDGPEPILHTSSVTNVINISLEELEFVFQWNLELEKTIPAIIRVGHSPLFVLPSPLSSLPILNIRHLVPPLFP